MKIYYTITETKTFEFDPKDVIALVVESRKKDGDPTDPGSVYDDAGDNLYRYLEQLGLPEFINEDDGISDLEEQDIMDAIDKCIDWDSEEL